MTIAKKTDLTHWNRAEVSAVTSELEAQGARRPATGTQPGSAGAGRIPGNVQVEHRRRGHAGIAALADVGAGTVYSYFKSKDELAIAVLERVMHNLAPRIEAVTETFEGPALVYAFGVRTVIEAATGDMRWKQLLHRSEVIANAMFTCMGPFAIRDLENATKAGRFKAADARLTR